MPSSGINLPAVPPTDVNRAFPPTDILGPSTYPELIASLKSMPISCKLSGSQNPVTPANNTFRAL